jgi:hypothetical protein
MPLVPCPSCRRHLRADETSCPFCRSARGLAAGLTALALSACPPPQPQLPQPYGAPPAPTTTTPQSTTTATVTSRTPDSMGEVYGAPPPPGHR